MLKTNPEMNCVQIEDPPWTLADRYARCEDFRRVFLENMDSIYQLCFLLTSDPDRAEQCFITSFDDCIRSHQVFREWAHPRAKRMLVQNATRAVQSRPTRAESSSPTNGFPHESLRTAKDACVNFVRVLSLQDFERFIFVLSVLEQYSDPDCAFLLGCFVEDIRNARMRAVEQLAACGYTDRLNPMQ